MSVVVLLLDDMRADQLEVLTATNARLAEHAVVFDRAYVTVPMCCPERASFLAGGFLPQYTGVLTNEAPRGGATVFPDEDTLATRLRDAGYATALYGKYLNEYTELGLYVPPGWSDWAVVTEGDTWTGFTYTAGSSTAAAPGTAVEATAEGYVTEWQGMLGARFVTDTTDPLFLLLSFRAPHDPHVPQASDVGAYADFTYRGGAWMEPDTSDKPAWIQQIAPWTDEEIATLDAENQERLETLLSVDRAVVRVMDALEAAGRLDDTVVLLTSDNGQLWGEHRLRDKGVGYEEAVRVPLVAWNPAFTGRHTDALVATNLDLAATITDLAGLPARGDGASLRGFLCEDTDATRDFVPLQGWTYTEPPWAGLVTPTWKYLENGAGEVELYDLVADPFEELNRAAVNPETVADLAATLAPLRGLAITTQELPAAQAGISYTATLAAWGGTGARTWRVSSGALPAGMTLDGDGTLSGTPLTAGETTFAVHVSDETISPVHGGPQTDQRSFTLTVAKGIPPGSEQPRRCGCDGGAAIGLGALAAGWWRRRRRASQATVRS